MEKQTTIYCSMGLLNHISEMFSLSFKNENVEAILIWTNWYNLILDKSQLFVDIDMDKIQRLSDENSLIRSLIRGNSRQSQKSQITPMPDFFTENRFEDIYPANSIFLLDKTKEECAELENQHGMIFISKENLFERAKLLFSSALYNVTKDSKAIRSFKNWEELQNFRHPFNAMIVVDNFILDTDKSKKNLISLLSNFLPLTLEKQILDLIIITNNQRRLNNGETQKYNLDSKYKEINAEIQKLRSYQINISLIIVDANQNHDRNIFTNYFWLHSGHSFDYFNDKDEVTNPTNLMIFPIFYQQDKISPQQNTVYEAVYQLLQEIKIIVDNSATQSERTEKKIIEKNACGNKQNRLLS